MATFDPTEIVRVLDEHGVRFVIVGGIAAALHGSDVATFDLDVSPLVSPSNFEHLSAALRDLGAVLRVEGTPEGIAFDPAPELLERMTVLNLMTRCGDLDIVVIPIGTSGYRDLERDAVPVTIHGVSILIASLHDVIRSKEAANREKDRIVLPRLRRLLAHQAVMTSNEDGPRVE